MFSARYELISIYSAYRLANDCRQVCVSHRAPGRSGDRPTKPLLIVAFSKCPVGAQTPRPTRSFSRGIPNTNVKTSPKTQPFQVSSKCRQRNTKSTQMLNFFSSAPHSKNPLPITLHDSLPNVTPCLQHIFTTRTSGHSPVTLRTINFCSPP